MPTGKGSDSRKRTAPLATGSAASRCGAAAAARGRLRWRLKSSARAATGRSTALAGPTSSPARVAALRKTAWPRRAVGVAPAPIWGVCHWHRPARPRRDVEREQPLVVPRRAPIRANRRFLAFAADTRDPACHSARARWLQRRVTAGSRLRRAERRHAARWLRGGAGLTGSGFRLASRNAGLLGAVAERHELAILRHRVLVLLAKEPVLDQKIDAWWKGVRDVRVLELEESDGSGVLLAAKHELGFLFAPGFVAPDRHQYREQDPHDGEGHQEGRHRVSTLVGLTA